MFVSDLSKLPPTSFIFHIYKAFFFNYLGVPSKTENVNGQPGDSGSNPTDQQPQLQTTQVEGQTQPNQTQIGETATTDPELPGSPNHD